MMKIHPARHAEPRDGHRSASPPRRPRYPPQDEPATKIGLRADRPRRPLGVGLDARRPGPADGKILLAGQVRSTAGTDPRKNFVTRFHFAEADLSITKTDGVTSAVPGQIVTYTIVAMNAGPSDDPSVLVEDAFPAVLSCTHTSVAAGGATGNTAAGAGDLAETLAMPANSSVTYTATCDIDPAATGTLSNTATITGSVTDPVAGNNSATDDDTVLVPTADVSITKDDGLSTAMPGDVVTYTIVASNAGPSDAPAATVSDVFPAEFTGASWTCAASAGSGCAAAGSGVTDPNAANDSATDTTAAADRSLTWARRTWNGRTTPLRRREDCHRWEISAALTL